MKLQKAKTFLKSIFPLEKNTITAIALSLYIAYFLFSYGRLLFIPNTFTYHLNEQQQFSLSYPSKWIATDYKNGFRNQPFRRTKFSNGDHIGIAKPTTIAIEVHTQEIENANIEKVLDWGSQLRQDTGNNVDEVEILIGKQDISGKMKIFHRGSGTERHVYFLDQNRAFIIVFRTRSGSDETNWRNIFFPALESFEIHHP